MTQAVVTQIARGWIVGTKPLLAVGYVVAITVGFIAALGVIVVIVARAAIIGAIAVPRRDTASALVR